MGITSCETCAQNPCHNNGVCQESYSVVGYKCICPAGFSGGHCENTGESCYPGKNYFNDFLIIEHFLNMKNKN